MLHRHFILLLAILIVTPSCINISQRSLEEHDKKIIENEKLDTITEQEVQYNIQIDTIPNLYIFYPKYTSIDLVVNKMPSYKDAKVLFCCSASFTGELLHHFKHSNIAGNHVSSGMFYRGYSCKPNTGCFVFYENRWKFLLHNYRDELSQAARLKGMGFGQNMIIYDYVTQPSFRKLSSRFVYRALCEFNDRLCIIETSKVVTYQDFISYLEDLKVRHALYLDMGSGWNYAWYRDNRNNIKHLHACPKPQNDFRTNWITFKK